MVMQMPDMFRSDRNSPSSSSPPIPLSPLVNNQSNRSSGVNSSMTRARVEEWLDSNPDCMKDYFLRKADLSLVNQWLISHGFNQIQGYLSKHEEVNSTLSNRTEYASQETSPSSPLDSPLAGESKFFGESRHHRTNSKKHLRQDFARSKTKNVSMFRTHEVARAESLTEARRSSLKEMRKYRSLPQNSINMLTMLLQSRIHLPRYLSKDVILKRELRQRNEKEFFLEIVKDISNDLDLRSLSAKIVANIALLVDADKGSLFLVKDKGMKPNLVSKLFDVHAGAGLLPSSHTDWMVQVPWGKGVIGYVADTGKTVNLRHASEDPRYNAEVDRITGYKTESLLCTPIRNSEDEIVGVAQVINKISDNGLNEDDEKPGFSEEDQKLLETYLTFCGIAIFNAQIFEAYSKEYERNKALLEVVHDVFEEQSSFENVILKIMQRAQTLLRCERCSVLLRENDDGPFTKVFDLSYPTRNGHSAISLDTCSDLKLGNSVAELVLVTGETINIFDAAQDPRFDRELDNVSGFHTRTILCKPIRDRNCKIIGVAQIINRVDAHPFDDFDDQLFEAFTIFCGLGIHNAMLYDEVVRGAAKQTVALEVLSYHVGITNEEVVKTKLKHVPDAYQLTLSDIHFNDFRLDQDEMLMAGIRIFQDLGLVKKFKIDYEILCRWILTVRKNYRAIAYHNWRHAFNVCQVMFCILSKSEIRRQLNDKEWLTLVVACLCHDLDHRGTNNAFQQKTSSALAQLYGTDGTLEHHHFNHAVMILNAEGHNIFGNMTSEEYCEVINLLKQAILATDLSLHFKVRSKFFTYVESDVLNWENQDFKLVLRDVLMTACDVAAITKPWDVQRKVADLVMAEFFQQGDKERNELKIQPQALMDRERQHELPKLQIGWIDGICLPLFKSLAKLDVTFQPMLDGVIANRQHWERLEAARMSQHIQMRTVIETGV